MKKLLFILTAMLFYTITNAQVFVQPVVKFGAGNPKYLYSGQSEAGFNYKAGMNAGYEFKGHIPVSLGFFYSHNSYDVKRYTGVGYSYKSYVYQSYQIPLTAGYYYDWKWIRLMANAGFYADYFIADNVFDNIGGRNYEGQLSFGYLFNIGAGYKLGKRWVASIAFEYNQLFSNNLKAKISGVADKVESYGSSNFYGVSVGISYSFNK